MGTNSQFTFEAEAFSVERFEMLKVTVIEKVQSLKGSCKVARKKQDSDWVGEKILCSQRRDVVGVDDFGSVFIYRRQTGEYVFRQRSVWGAGGAKAVRALWDLNSAMPDGYLSFEAWLYCLLVPYEPKESLRNHSSSPPESHDLDVSIAEDCSLE